MFQLAAVAGCHLEGIRPDEETAFCSYCTKLGQGSRRVCESCGLGVVLKAPPGVLRSPGAAFLIVDAEGAISGVSAPAEKIVGRQEDLIGRPVPTVLTAENGSGELEIAIARAATGVGTPATLAVARVQGGALHTGLQATVGTCGEPRAALVVLQQTGPDGD